MSIAAWVFVPLVIPEKATLPADRLEAAIQDGDVPLPLVERT
jgi:hypothetical protein